jgi:hypothetical protein
MGLRWHWSRSARDAFRDLLGGDLVFFEDDPSGGGGGDDPPGGGGADDPPPAPAADDDPPGGDDDPDPEPKAVSAEEARKMRSENRNLRKRAKEAEERLKRLEDKDATDLEKTQRERDAEKEARSKAEEEARTLRVQVVATKVGIRPEAAKVAANLVDWEDIDSSDESAVSDALKGLKTEHGYLFKTGADDIGAGKSHHDRPDDDDVTPGRGRLEKAYADASK